MNVTILPTHRSIFTNLRLCEPLYIDKIKRAILESHQGAVDVDYTFAAAEA
jgi:hypothetical protein